MTENQRRAIAIVRAYLAAHPGATRDQVREAMRNDPDAAAIMIEAAIDDLIEAQTATKN